MKLKYPALEHPIANREINLTEKGKPEQSLTNIATVLANPRYAKKDGVYEGQIFFDLFSNKLMFEGTIRGEGTSADKIRLWNDDMCLSLGLEIEMDYKLNFNSSRMRDATRLVGRLCQINALRQIIENLKWDGNEEAIANLLPSYLGAEQSPLNTWIMEHMILGIIKRIFEPGSKFDEMMILVGGQGIGKSTFVRYMALEDDWYASLGSIQGKDSVINMMGKAVIEIEEFVALRNVRTQGEAKSFISKSKDTIRLPYGHNSSDILRTCVLIGTTNEYNFLHDHTGERRYLPIECHGDKRSKTIYPVKSELDGMTEEKYNQEVKADFLQAFAQGYYIYKNNLHEWSVPSELEDELKRQQEQFKYLDPNEEALRYFLNITKENSDMPYRTC